MVQSLDRLSTHLRDANPILKRLSLYGFAFSCLLSTTLAELFLWLSVGLSLLTGPWNLLWKEKKLLIAWSLLVFYLLARTSAAVFWNPTWAAWHLRGAWGWFRLLLFPLVGLLCANDMAMCRRLLALATIGLLVGIGIHLDTQILESAWQGMRTGFNHRIVAFGLYSGTVVWGLLCFASRFWFAPMWRKPLTLLWGVLLCLFAQGMILTQSRGTWIAFLTTAFLAAWWVNRAWRPHDASLKRRFRAGFAAALLLFSLLAAINWPRIEQRWLQEKDTLLRLTHFDFQKPANDSVGYRAHLYRFAITSILDEPLWGYGPAESYYFIRESGLETLRVPNWKGRLQWWDHLHSTPLEVFFHYGLIGAVLFGSLLLDLYQRIWAGWEKGHVDAALALFCLASLTFMLLWSLFDFRALHPDWRYYWNLLGGLLVAVALSCNNPNEQEKTPTLHCPEGTDT